MSLLAAVVIGAPLRVLFLGNSHTQFNDLPKLVAALGQARNRPINFQVFAGATLDQLHGMPQVRNAITSGRFDAVVLQGQSISMSHKYTYSNKEAIELAKVARQNGAQAYLFSEWPRRGIEETAYIEGIYKKIADASGAKIIPVGRVWDAVLREQRNLRLWADDGNHASPLGSCVAAFAIYRALTQDKDGGFPTLDLGKDQAALFWKASGIVLE